MSRTVTKMELVERVARMNGVDPREVKPIVQSVFDCLKDYLVDGRRIELRNFGVFSVKHRKPRIGRNPNKPQQEIKIPSVPVPTFKPGRILKQQVKDSLT